MHDQRVAALQGQPAALRSQTKITAEQILAIGLPDLAEKVLPGAADVVTARGELITIDAKRYPDLYWAVRGGAIDLVFDTQRLGAVGGRLRMT